MTQMINVVGRLGAERSLKLWADWTDRIAAGELPFAKPERPQGIERNVVLTLWDWSRPTAYLHDLIGTDRRKPTLYPNGKLYGSPEESTDYVPILDPVTHTATEVKHPVRDPKTPSSKDDPMAPSPYWGDEPIWDSQTSNHNPMMDEKGRVWFTTRVRPPANPDFCKKGSDHPSAKVFPLENANRHLSMYDPATGKFTLISTCFPTHHLIFAEDANNTLWTSAGGPASGVVGWLNRKMFEETGDEVKSQGWTPFILDTNGNGKRDEYVEPDQPVDPTKDKRVAASLLQRGREPGRRVRLGDVAGIPRLRRARQPRSRSDAHRADGNLRAAVAGLWAARRRHRSQRRVLGVAGERPSRELRPEQVQGPAQRAERDRQALPRRLDALSAARTAVQGRAGRRQRRVELLHLGRLVRHVRAGQERADRHRQHERRALALVDGKFVNLRVPYPIGFFTKWVEGRIDDANAGWKGRVTVDDLLHQNDVPPRRRQGEPAEGREVPAAARSAGAVNGSRHVSHCRRDSLPLTRTHGLCQP